jgi:hypothetical protein
MLKFISIKNSSVAFGVMVFLSLTINNASVQAMEPDDKGEKDRSLYTTVMKHVVDPSVGLNLEYLATLPQTLTEKVKLNSKRLFSEPTDPKQKMSAIVLAILAADETRVKEFLAGSGSSKAGSSQEGDFTRGCSHTSKAINPNDPSLYMKYNMITMTEPEPCGIIYYGLVHLALRPDIAILGLGPTGFPFGPSYLPDFKISLESRFGVLDALAEAGADFNAAPSKYLPSKTGTDERVFDWNPLRATRLYPSYEASRQLQARAVLHGANIEDNFYIRRQGELPADTDKFRVNLLKIAFHQIVEGKIKTENIRPSEFVRRELEKLKNEEIRAIVAQLKTLEQEKLLMPLTDGGFGTGEEQVKKVGKLTRRLERIQQLTF